MTKSTKLPTVCINTPLGSIEAEIDVASAPRTGENFLRYVDHDLYRAAAFYRTVRAAEDPNPVKISAVQGGLHQTSDAPTLGTIPHEGTDVTGLRHDVGTLSMARNEIGTAASEFFIVLEGAAELDAGGRRQPDGQGFAAFGRVVAGMDVVRAISTLESVSGSDLAGVLVHPVPITAIRRIAI